MRAQDENEPSFIAFVLCSSECHRIWKWVETRNLKGNLFSWQKGFCCNLLSSVCPYYLSTVLSSLMSCCSLASSTFSATDSNQIDKSTELLRKVIGFGKTGTCHFGGMCQPHSRPSACSDDEVFMADIFWCLHRSTDCGTWAVWTLNKSHVLENIPTWKDSEKSLLVHVKFLLGSQLGDWSKSLWVNKQRIPIALHLPSHSQIH